MPELNLDLNFDLSLNAIIQAVLLLIVCLIAVKILMAASGKLLNKSKLDKSLHSIILSTLKVLLVFMTIMIVAPSLGIETSSLLAVLSIAGVAVSLSIQGILGNFFSGVTLLMSKPYKVGDFVTIGGQSGTIVETGITHTKLHTPDNQVILVPNSSVTSNVIINVSTEDIRRLDFTFTASMADEEIKLLLAKCYDNACKVLRENRGLLDEIALFLLQKETITGDEFMTYVNADKKRLEEPKEEPTEQTDEL